MLQQKVTTRFTNQIAGSKVIQTSTSHDDILNQILNDLKNFENNAKLQVERLGLFRDRLLRALHDIVDIEISTLNETIISIRLQHSTIQSHKLKHSKQIDRILHEYQQSGLRSLADIDKLSYKTEKEILDIAYTQSNEYKTETCLEDSIIKLNSMHPNLLNITTPLRVQPKEAYSYRSQYDEITKTPMLSKESKHAKMYESESSGILCLALSIDDKLIIAGLSDGMIKIWNSAENRSVANLKAHKNCVSTVAVSYDNRCIMSGSLDCTIKIWSMTDLTLENVIEVNSWISSVRFTYDNSYIIAGLYDTTIRLWSISSQTSSFSYIGHEGSVFSIAITTDSQFLVSGAADNTVRIWNLTTQSSEGVLTGHTDWVHTVVLTSDNQYIISGSSDATIRLWNLSSKSQLSAFLGHTEWVKSIVLSYDNRYIISGSGDQTVRIWSLEEKKLEKVLEGHKDSVNSVTVSRDSQYIVSGSYDKSLRLWSFYN